MATHVALLYSVVLGPDRRVVMSTLRAMVERLGFGAPRSLVATGNLVFDADETVPTIERRIEAAFIETFRRHVDIIVRDAPAWRRLVAGNPFPSEAVEDGGRVAVRVMRTPVPAAALDGLAPFVDDAEMQLVDGDIWVRFPGRPSASRLLGALTTRRLGIGTMRNWNTVRRLGEMLDG